METQTSITRIKAPKFRIGRYSLNEYELRKLMLEVCKGEKPEYVGRKVYDSLGRYGTINPDGKLSECLEGLSMCGELAMDMFRTERRKEFPTLESYKLAHL